MDTGADWRHEDGNAGPVTKGKHGSEPATVEVVGAGPAGLAAAITLARGGRRVVVHEARHEVGHRFRRDLQGLENWSGDRDVLTMLNDVGLTTRFNAIPCSEGTGFDAWNRAYPLRGSAPLCYLVERGPGPGSLDRALLDQALASGVEVRFGSRKQRLDGQGIFASGPRKADAIAVGYHFMTRLADGFWIILDDNLAPGGYAYLLTMRGWGTVKSCMFHDFANQRVYVERTVERFRHLLGVDMRDARFHGGVANFFVPPTACRGPHPVIGEAAGFQDAFAGFGMRYAMLSGVTAAHSLMNGTDYDIAWRREIMRSMETAHVNRAIYDRLGNKGYRWLLRLQTVSGDGRGFLGRLYRSAHIRRLLLPFARGTRG
jgi:flavin-dependent dehydrogenase